MFSLDPTAAYRCTLLLWKGPWADKTQFSSVWTCSTKLHLLWYSVKDTWVILSNSRNLNSRTMHIWTGWMVVPLDHCPQQSNCQPFWPFLSPFPPQSKVLKVIPIKESNLKIPIFISRRNRIRQIWSRRNGNRKIAVDEPGNVCSVLT